MITRSIPLIETLTLLGVLLSFDREMNLAHLREFAPERAVTPVVSKYHAVVRLKGRCVGSLRQSRHRKGEAWNKSFFIILSSRCSEESIVARVLREQLENMTKDVDEFKMTSIKAPLTT